MAKKKVTAKAPARVEVPAAVWAAMAQHGLHPEELQSWQVTEHDVHLHLRNRIHLRIERSSLLERFDTQLQPGSGSISKTEATPV